MDWARFMVSTIMAIRNDEKAGPENRARVSVG
jgi:hypothetical protein